MIKHRKKITFFVFFSFVLSPLYSYAFMTLSPNSQNITQDTLSFSTTTSEQGANNTDSNKLKLEEQKSVKTSVPSLSSGKEETTSTQLDSSVSGIKLEEKKVNIQGDNSDKVEFLQTKDPVQEEKSISNKPMDNFVKPKIDSMQNYSLPKKDKTSKQPKINNNLKKIASTTSTRKETKKQNQIKLIFGADKIKNLLRKEIKKEEIDTEPLVQEALKSLEEIKKVKEFFGTLDATSSLAILNKKENEMLEKISQAVVHMEKQKIFHSCLRTHTNRVNSGIERYYNIGKIMEDRGDKTMIAFSLLKQEQKIDPMVDIVMKMFNHKIKVNQRRAFDHLQKTLNLLEEVQNINMPSNNRNTPYHYYVCRYIKRLFAKINRELSFAVGYVHNQNHWLRNMKKVIAEFTDQEPFDQDFLDSMACNFYLSYFKNYEESDKVCDKNKGPF